MVSAYFFSSTGLPSMGTVSVSFSWVISASGRAILYRYTFRMVPFHTPKPTSGRVVTPAGKVFCALGLDTGSLAMI